MNTVLITGCSTGFVRETAIHFSTRDPAASTLPASDKLRVLELDVADPESIAATTAEAGAVDVAGHRQSATSGSPCPFNDCSPNQ